MATQPRRPPRRLVVSVVVGVLAVFAGGCVSGSEGKFGEELYQHSCATCHGEDLGGGIGPALGPGSNAIDLTDEQLAGAIRVGPGSMPGYGHLTDDQVDSLVQYLRQRQE